MLWIQQNTFVNVKCQQQPKKHDVAKPQIRGTKCKEKQPTAREQICQFTNLIMQSTENSKNGNDKLNLAT